MIKILEDIGYISDELYDSEEDSIEEKHYEGEEYLTIEGTFLVNCKKYATGNIEIPDGVTVIGGNAFYKCTSIESITIPNSVIDIRKEAFSFCTSLISINIPNGITRIRAWVFLQCKSLTSVNIPNSVTSICEGAFRFCDSLTKVTIPDSVIEIGKYAFEYCPSLTIKCSKGSYAEGYAKMNKIPVEYV